MEQKLTPAQVATEKAILLFGTQRLLAEAIGVRQPTIHRWLTGKALPTAEPLVRLEAACGRKIRVQDFFE